VFTPSLVSPDWPGPPVGSAQVAPTPAFQPSSYFVFLAGDLVLPVIQSRTFGSPRARKTTGPMAATTTIQVPHLGGIQVGYRLSGDCYDAKKPTCVLINSMCMTVSLYKDQFDNPALTDVLNLLAIEPLGHGATSCPVEHFTYWDSAIMALQVMDKLCIDKAFALGTSQGGWMVTRMALVAPERVCPFLFLSFLFFFVPLPLYRKSPR